MCTQIYQKKYREENKEAAMLYQRQYRKDNGGKERVSRIRNKKDYTKVISVNIAG